ncbi:uncharacterized protein [Haliotis cracherodii]|uniref:uncharacterized protein n=1 Tax=Haliotis cracherodii TaxID=6455 RepID=UPI0039E96857
MLDTSERAFNPSNVDQILDCEMDTSDIESIDEMGFHAQSSLQKLSSAAKLQRANMDNISKGENTSPLSGQELSQDLFSLIDSFNLEAPVENFNSGDTNAFQSVIDDVIDAAPSGDEFDFLDNICGFTSGDIPVKHNSSSVTGTACVYTCASEKDRRGNQLTCARTESSTCISGVYDTWNTLSPADQELLEKLPVFLENVDSVLISNATSGCVRSKKRERDFEFHEIEPRKRLRSEDARGVFNNSKDNADTGILTRDNICARGS